MVKKEKTTVKKEPESNSAENNYSILIPCNHEEKIKVVCDVCGHANPQYTALCEMCSNYLTK